jgi:hypothetical protein
MKTETTYDKSHPWNSVLNTNVQVIHFEESLFEEHCIKRYFFWLPERIFSVYIELLEKTFQIYLQ